MSSAFDSLKGINKDNWRTVLGQFIKFGLIGASNTLISTAVYYIFVWIDPALYMVGNIVGWIVSVFNSFVWNNRFVFRDSQFSWWKKLFRTYLAYAGSLVLGSILLAIQVDLLDVSQWLAPWINMVITIPLNFIVNKFWAFKA